MSEVEVDQLKEDLKEEEEVKKEKGREDFKEEEQANEVKKEEELGNEAKEEVNDDSKREEKGDEVKEEEEGGEEYNINGGVLVEENVAWFQELRKLSTEQVQCPLDLFSFLLHSFMLELGFQNDSHGRLGEKWSSAVGHVTRYWLDTGDTTAPQTTDIVLTVTTLGHIVKVHGTHSGVKTTFSTSKLNPKDYVTRDGEQMEPKNLRQLARVFKNEVGVPLLNCARSHLGLSVSGLQGLPPELVLKVLNLLPFQGVVRVSAVSKQLRVICQDPALWRKLYIRNFGLKPYLDRKDTKWLSVFKEAKKNEKIRYKARRPNPPLFPFPDPSSTGPVDPRRPPVPGILGGDYDRFPGGGHLPLFGGHTLDPTNFLPRPRFDPPGPGLPRRGGGNFPGSGFGGGFGGGFL